MNGARLQLALREWAREAISPFALVVIVLATMVLTISGPFDTLHSLDTAPRAAYWALTCVASYLAAKTVAILLRPHLARLIDAPRPRLLARSIILTLPAGGVALVVHAGFFGAASPDIVPGMLLRSAVLTIAITLVVGLTRERFATSGAVPRNRVGPEIPADATPQPAETARPALLDRLPPSCRGALIALSAEDHYVAVRTEHGRALILMRLADAIREAAPTPGLQIHRSHWVALAAVREVRREGGRMTVRLSSGGTLPVSRGFAEAVRQAGLLS